MLLSFHLIKFPKIIKWEMSFSAQNEVNSYFFSWIILNIFFLDETKMEFMPSPMSAAPLTPPASVGKYFCSLQHAQNILFSSKFSAPVSPEQSPVPEERLSRKRCQNKQSSKRYRQKIKNKEQALFDAVGDLNKVSYFYI